MFSDDTHLTDHKKRPVDPLHVSEVEMLTATLEATSTVAGPEESVAEPAEVSQDQHETNHTIF